MILELMEKTHQSENVDFKVNKFYSNFLFNFR